MSISRSLHDHLVGGDVLPILSIMFKEQNEHSFAITSEVYGKYRRAVAAWMMEICEYFNMHQTTTHAAIAYLDRLQPTEKFTRNDWQMLALACILLAAKYNETEDDLPMRVQLEDITEQRISNKLILNFEIWVLMKLSWKMTAYTPCSFLSCYMARGITFETDKCSQYPNLTSRSNKLNSHVQRLVDMIILEESVKGFAASDVAGAIVFVSRQNLDILPSWTPELTELMNGLKPSNPIIQNIIRLIQIILANAPTEPHQSDSYSLQLSPQSSRLIVTTDQTSPETGKENMKVTFTSPVSVANSEQFEV